MEGENFEYIINSESINFQGYFIQKYLRIKAQKWAKKKKTEEDTIQKNPKRLFK
jgi:hypothetical protein